MTSEIRKKRKEFGLSQEELAKRLGVSRQSLFSLEKGICKPSLDLLAKLEFFFNTSWRDLFPEACFEKEFTKKSKDNLQTNFYSQGKNFLRKKEEIMKKDFLEDDLDFFGSLVPREFRIWQNHFSPKINLLDEGENLKLEADLPGFNKEDVSIEARENQITIKASRKTEEEREKKNYYYHEASASEVKRTIMLPCKIDSEKIRAELKNGRLIIWLPKKEAKESEGKIIRLE